LLEEKSEHDQKLAKTKAVMSKKGYGNLLFGSGYRTKAKQMISSMNLADFCSVIEIYLEKDREDEFIEEFAKQTWL